MKFHLSTITLAIGFSLGIAAHADVAEAGFTLNGSSLTGKVSRPTSQEYSQQQNKGLNFNSSSLTGKVSRPTSKEYSQQQNKIITFNGSSLTRKKAKSK